MSSVRKATKAFGSYESRRAPAFIKGKSGYDAGFLPRNTSPIRFPRPVGTVQETARQSNKSNTQAKEKSEIAEWKKQLSENRRTYMADHIIKKVENTPKRREEVLAKAKKGRLARETILTAPESEAELLSLPSIEQSIADEYPLRDDNKEERELQKTRNREAHEAFAAETRLHQFLTIHHNSSKYVTTIEGLDELLENKIGSAQYFDVVPKYRIQDLIGGPGSGSYSFSKVNQLETAIDDQIMGTAGGGKPGVVEVSHLLETQAKSEDS